MRLPPPLACHIEALESRIAPAVTLALSLGTLNGSNGFQIRGETVGDYSGGSVSGAGDVNGDGFADLLIGAVGVDLDASSYGASYVVFGNGSGFPASLGLSTLNGINGFKIMGQAPGDRLGYSVSGAGDVNGDGFDDLIIGADGVDSQGLSALGASYVIFGKAGGSAAVLNVASLDGTNGFVMLGQSAGDRLGQSVSGAGDVNGDGFSDVIMAAEGVDYVVFGKAGGFTPAFDLARLDGSNGFKIVRTGTPAGGSVSGAGDVNGDGFDDLIIGVPLRKASGLFSETSYVVFGRKVGFAATLDLVTLDGSNGFKLKGEKGDDSGIGNVSRAGDVNGDGFGDLLIAANGAALDGSDSAGESYVVFGRAGGFGATLKLSALDGTNGFKLVGEAEDIDSGSSVSAAGDMNGDGFDDLLIGNDGDSSTDLPSAGATYVVFGKASGFKATLKLSALNGINGFKILGDTQDDRSGVSVSGAGDVNGDGFDDLLIGADGADFKGAAAGASYVLFGQAAIAAGVGLSQSARSFSFTEPDGDRVTVSISKGNIAREKITLELAVDGGALLSRLELTGKGANKGARLKIVAVTGPPPLSEGGNALGVGNVGIPDIGTLSLPEVGAPKKVNIKGNVQEVTVPKTAQLALFKVLSLGADAGLFPGTPAKFTAAGTITKLVVRQDVIDDYLVDAKGAVAQMIVGGRISDSVLTFSKPLQHLYVGSNVRESTLSFNKGVGTVSVGGDVSDSEIKAQQIAVVNIAGVLSASSLVAGATRGADAIFGTADDQYVGSGRAGVVASIARITLGGVGGSITTGDGFGIVAEEIGKLKIGPGFVTLMAGGRNDLTPIPLLPSGATDDLFAREVAPL